jgi:hypothetical protein
MIADSDNRQITLIYDDRHWRVRGLEKQLSCERLKVNLMVACHELVPDGVNSCETKWEGKKRVVATPTASSKSVLVGCDAGRLFTSTDLQVARDEFARCMRVPVAPLRARGQPTRLASSLRVAGS